MPGPYGSGGANPVADVASPSGKNLYVVNHDSNTIVVFTISTDGSLSQQQSCPTPGTLPTQLAINSAGAVLSGTLTQTLAAGVARFTTLKISKAGSFTLKASDTLGLAAVTSPTFKVA